MHTTYIAHTCGSAKKEKSKSLGYIAYTYGVKSVKMPILTSQNEEKTPYHSAQA